MFSCNPQLDWPLSMCPQSRSKPHEFQRPKKLERPCGNSPFNEVTYYIPLYTCMFDLGHRVDRKNPFRVIVDPRECSDHWYKKFELCIQKDLHNISLNTINLWHGPVDQFITICTSASSHSDLFTSSGHSRARSFVCPIVWHLKTELSIR